ncbi:MAG: cytochrome c [Oscillatoria sp. PMC 1068.18]|nr:cytochrome c [Oscillatoria sp. PMC 1076.18]MEC4989951.1 cytochrome c [Oscillatoria sp. PMC 1068.18]
MLEKNVDNQFANPKIITQRITLIVMAVVLAILASILVMQRLRASDPYIQEVFSQVGNPAKGQAIFEINCAGCHGFTADGNVGPSLHNVSKRRSPLNLIEQVTSGDTPPMPKFQPSPQEMADLLSYLKQL